VELACLGKTECWVGGNKNNNGIKLDGVVGQGEKNTTSAAAPATSSSSSSSAGAPGESAWVAVEVLCGGGRKAVTAEVQLPAHTTTRFSVPLDSVTDDPFGDDPFDDERVLSGGDTTPPLPPSLQKAGSSSSSSSLPASHREALKSWSLGQAPYSLLAFEVMAGGIERAVEGLEVRRVVRGGSSAAKKGSGGGRSYLEATLFGPNAEAAGPRTLKIAVIAEKK
jgi:hypothetical protein